MSTELVIETGPLPGQPSGTIVIYTYEGQPPTGAGAAIWAATGLDWARVAGAANFTGKQGQVLDLPAPAGLEADRLLTLGAGKPPAPGDTNLTSFADRGGSLMAKLGRAEKAFVLLDGPEFRPEAVAEIVAGLRLRHYRFDKYKARKDDDNEPKTLTVTLLVADKAAADAAIAVRAASVDGALLARDLINEPANVLGPVELSAEIEKLADRGLTVEILTDADMARLGMNSLLSVAWGSRRPARLGVIQWRGGKPDAAPLAFVGKGVCFDTGGISIKQAGGMEDMKGDMAGAAAVIGLLSALAARQAPVNAVGVVGLVENMPDGNALRPGDIVKAMSGTTIEVNNTDAEGRLVLADALWYTQDRFKPAFMINLATLTGAIIMSLGHDFAGLFSNNDELAGRLYAAGMASGEKLWRMPMASAYEKLLDSRFADIKNTGGRPGAPFAAHFLQRFVNGVPWAHLDIAGTAFGGPATETNAGWASGFGVALLDRLVRDFYEA